MSRRRRNATGQRVHMMFDLRSIRPSALLPLLFVACVAALSGCDRNPGMGQVRGKVFYKDGSVPHGGVCVVSLLPAGSTTAKIRKGASGAIEKDGSFEMMTRKPGDGVYYGDYVVTFTVVKGPNDPTSLILPVYSNPRETPYKLTVDGDKVDLKYEIEPLPGVTGSRAGK